MPSASILTVVGAICIASGVLIGPESKVFFFSLMSAGALALCTTTAGVNMGIMASVPPRTRSFAIGISTLLTHALGDVPAPPIIGAIAEDFSPQTCDPNSAANRLSSRLSRVVVFSLNLNSTSGSACDGKLIRDPHGLQVTLFLVTTWLIWPALLWAFAWLYAEKRNSDRRAAAEVSAGRALGGAHRLKALLKVLNGAALPFTTFVRAVATVGGAAVEGLRRASLRARGFTLEYHDSASSGTELLVVAASLSPS